MGFYLELRKAVVDGSIEFREQVPPPVFWLLYFVAGFALVCMGAAAYALLGDLVRSGSFWDVLIVAVILSAVPLYLLLGLKLMSLRKKVLFTDDKITCGFQWRKRLFFRVEVPHSDAREVVILNQRPAPNVAPSHHDDRQYYIRGHWRVGIQLKNGKTVILDRHTEKEALEPLRLQLENWITGAYRRD